MSNSPEWIENALVDWGHRHREKAGQSLGFKSCSAGFETPPRPGQYPNKPSALSMLVDRAIKDLELSDRQGETEAAILRLRYLERKSFRKIGAALKLNDITLRNNIGTGHRFVGCWLEWVAKRSPDDFEKVNLFVAPS